MNKSQILCGRSLNFTLYIRIRMSFFRLLYNKGKLAFTTK